MARRTVSRPFDIRRLLVQRIDKRHRRLEGFEALHRAKAEARHRVRLLKRQGCHKLAHVLLACRKRQRCGSKACPVCSRIRRVRSCASRLSFLAAYEVVDLALVTLINPADARHAGALHTFDPDKAINRFRRQFERAGIDKSKAFLIGGLDGDWDEGWELYQPHLHVIAYGFARSDFDRLIKNWPTDERVRVRARVEPIDDLPRVVAYLDKAFWPSVARANNPLGIHPHGKQRAPAVIEAETLTFLHAAGDLDILFGAKSYGGTIVKSG